MSDKPIPVSAKILDKEYTISCLPEEHAALLASVQQVDDKMREIRSGSKIISAERLAVMAAINIAHEMLMSKHQVDNIDVDVITRLDDLQAKVYQTLDTLSN